MKYKALIFAAIGFLVYWFFLRKGAPLSPVTAQTTGKGPSTTNPPASMYAGWTGFTKASLSNQTQTVTDTFTGLKSLSNAFGKNDGGNSKVAISGSNVSGTSSSGSGAGVPLKSASGLNLTSGPLTGERGVNEDATDAALAAFNSDHPDFGGADTDFDNSYED